MSEEKKIFYKTLNIIVATNRIDNKEIYIINNYVSGLENIIKEVREIVKELRLWNCTEQKILIDKFSKRLLEILDKGEY